MKIQFTYLTILATFAGVNAAVASTCLKNRQDPEESDPSTTASTTPTITTTTTTTSPSPVNDSSDTDIIVGGAVGGVATLALLALLIICLRRRRKRDELDDNHIVSHRSGGGTLPQVDLGDECGIAPYPESPSLADSAGAGAAAAAGIYRTTSPLSSPSENSDIATPPGEGYPSQGFVRPGPAQYPQPAQSMYGIQQADWHNSRPLTSLAPGVMNTSSSRAMKKREAAAGRQGLGLATQQEVDGEASGVVQHEDGGQAHSEEKAENREMFPLHMSL